MHIRFLIDINEKFKSPFLKNIIFLIAWNEETFCLSHDVDVVNTWEISIISAQGDKIRIPSSHGLNIFFIIIFIGTETE